MNAQLAAMVESFESATRRLQVLGASLSPEEWSRRPGAGRWSPIECVAHLNLTASAMLPLVRDGIERARALGRPGPRRYRRDLVGWLLARGLSTPGRFKSKTTRAFVPPASVRVPDVLDEFGRLQAEQIACTRASDGLPVDRVKVASPFNARLRYSVYSALAISAVHEHRHLWQAEQARLELSRPGEF